MYQMESNQHTRNYGCRLRRYLLDGVEMLSLENQLLKVVFALGKGADIVEFLYKPTDTDVMWHSFNQLKTITHIPTVAASAGIFWTPIPADGRSCFPPMAVTPTTAAAISASTGKRASIRGTA